MNEETPVEKMNRLIKGLEAAGTEMYKRMNLHPQFRMVVKQADKAPYVDAVWNEEGKTAVIVVTEVETMREAIGAVGNMAVRILEVGSEDYKSDDQIDIKITREESPS